MKIYMQDYKEITKAIEALITGAKSVKISLANCLQFSKVCQALEINVCGGAISEGGEFKYFYKD